MGSFIGAPENEAAQLSVFCYRRYRTRFGHVVDALLSGTTSTAGRHLGRSAPQALLHSDTEAARPMQTTVLKARKSSKSCYDGGCSNTVWGRNGFDGNESLCEGVSGSELP